MRADNIVVETTPVTLTLSDNDREVYVARIPELGITAYADNPIKAQVKLQQMFESLVRVLGREGILEARLSKSGLPWCRDNN